MTCLDMTELRPADPLGARRSRILQAAAACFVRAGFHKSTMGDVAAEAGMSAGNVYRYFPSKDAIVEGLVARDRAEVAAGFERLRADDPVGSLGALARRQILDSGRDTAALRLEICAEATRNPDVAAVMVAFEAEVMTRLVGFFEAAVANRGPAPSRPTPRALAELVTTFMGGVMMTCAMGATPDQGERRLGDLLAIVEAALDGRLAAPATPGPGGGR